MNWICLTRRIAPLVRALRQRAAHAATAGRPCGLRPKVASRQLKQKTPASHLYRMRLKNRMRERCALLTWWLQRGGCTRSHSELGRETPLRQWYFVSRRGRVGRCQVCQTQRS